MKKHTTRRRFIAGTASALAAPMFIPANVLGKDGGVAPSNRTTVAAIGWGLQGPGNTDKLMQFDDCQAVAVCDVDEAHLKEGVEAVNAHYGNQDCKGYLDYRELLARKDIDAVTIALPDNWHGIVSIAALNAGKDVWGEKPLAQTIGEGRAIVNAVARNHRVWQTGSWQRSVFNFREGAELVLNGRIGKVRKVQIGLPAGHTDYRVFFKNHKPGPGYMEPTNPPSTIHYDMWLGPAQWEPYIEARHHINWRWNYNIGGGNLMDWVGHHNDIAHWALGFDNTGPIEVEAHGTLPAPDALWNTATSFHITSKYANGVEITIASNDHPDFNFTGTKWIGDDGWVFVDRGKYEASNMKWTREKIGKDEQHLPKSTDHWRNFLDCIKSREQTITPAETAQRSVTPGHLGNIAMILGRKLHWDPVREIVKGDAAATRMVNRPFRAPWS